MEQETIILLPEIVTYQGNTAHFLLLVIIKFCVSNLIKDPSLFRQSTLHNTNVTAEYDRTSKNPFK